MDTVSVSLNFEKALSGDEIEKLEESKFIGYKSRGKKLSTTVTLKISYPKFIGENNATLVHSSEVVLACNREFVKKIREIRPTEAISIVINRVDIPYTYIMPKSFEFSEYHNVFYRMADAYARRVNSRRKNIKKDDNEEPELEIEIRPKAIFDFLENTVETVILADNKNTKNYDHKITIYNQYQRFIQTHESDLKSTLVEHEDLPRRIRIEVSKRIDLTRKLILEDFANIDLYKNYNNKFLDYALNYLFGNDNKQLFYNERINKWKSIFMNKGSNSYETLIYKHLYYGEGYDILRSALCAVIKNKNTRESAITSIRKAIVDYEKRKGVIVGACEREYENIWMKLMSYRTTD